MKETLLVLGTAPCVFDDMERAPDGDRMVVNLAGVHFRHFKYWASVNEHEMQDLLDARSAAGLSKKGFEIHVPGDFPNATVWRKYRCPSSGLFAARIGVKLGYDRVILCGVPQSGINTFDGHKGNYEDVWFAWEERLPELRGRVFSMSGQTKDWFGEPK